MTVKVNILCKICPIYFSAVYEAKKRTSQETRLLWFECISISQADISYHFCSGVVKAAFQSQNAALFLLHFSNNYFFFYLFVCLVRKANDFPTLCVACTRESPYLGNCVELPKFSHKSGFCS